jgi:hypothetical protein
VSEPKTNPTKVSAESHIAAIAKEAQRNDARTQLALGHEASLFQTPLVESGF